MIEREIRCELDKLTRTREIPCKFGFACVEKDETKSSQDFSKCPGLPARSGESGEIRMPILNRTPQNIINSEILVEKILPFVKATRLSIFKCENPPFAKKKVVEALAESSKWIESTAKKPLPESAQRNKEAIIQGGLTRPTLEYLTPDCVHSKDAYPKVVCAWHPELSLLSENAALIASGTGFSKNAVVNFILTGAHPVLERAKIRWEENFATLPTGEHLTSFNVTIKVFAKDLQFKELQAIYEKVRSKLKMVKKKPLNKKHFELYREVQKSGIPSKGKVDFWEKIAKKFGYKKYTSAWIIYNRFQKKLDSNKKSYRNR